MAFQFPEHVRSIRPYVPGKPISEVKREFGIKKVIKLASNENPLGASPQALAAIRKNLKQQNRYPDSSAYSLKKALSRACKVQSHALCIGNGSNELIELLICALCSPGDSIVTSQSAFVAYKVCAQVHGIRTLESPLTSDLRFDLSAMAQMIREDSRAKIAFIPNPNNPTGTYVGRNELDAFFEKVAEIERTSGRQIVIVLDYAYWEYVTAGDLSEPIGYTQRYRNAVVLKTFSKVYGLAGLRIGYAIGPEELIAVLEKIREPFNVSDLGQAAAEAALGDKEFIRRAQRLNRQGMRFWEAGLEILAIPYWKSQGNFILLDVQRGMGKSGNEVFEACMARGVIFRPVANYGLSHALRVTIGMPKENEFALKVLKKEQGGRP